MIGIQVGDGVQHGNGARAGASILKDLGIEHKLLCKDEWHPDPSTAICIRAVVGGALIEIKTTCATRPLTWAGVGEVYSFPRTTLNGCIARQQRGFTIYLMAYEPWNKRCMIAKLSDVLPFIERGVRTLSRSNDFGDMFPASMFCTPDQFDWAPTSLQEQFVEWLSAVPTLD